MFVYQMDLDVEFQGEEVRQLIELSRHHYDNRCRAAAQPGGILMGISNTYRNLSEEGGIDWSGTVRYRLTFQEIDLLAKIAEAENGYRIEAGRPVLGKLGQQLHSLLSAMSGECQRLYSEAGKQPIDWQPAMRKLIELASCGDHTETRPGNGHVVCKHCGCCMDHHEYPGKPAGRCDSGHAKDCITNAIIEACGVLAQATG